MSILWWTLCGDGGRSAQTGWHSTHERLVADSSDESTEGSIGLTGTTSWLIFDTDHLCFCSAICLLQFFLCTRSDAVQQRFCSVLAGVSAKWSCSYLVLAYMGTHLISSDIIWYHLIICDGFQFLWDIWWIGFPWFPTLLSAPGWHYTWTLGCWLLWWVNRRIEALSAPKW